MELKAPFKASPLAHREAISSDTVALSERPFDGIIVVRGEFDALKATLASGGLALPDTATFSESGTMRAHWIGPDTIYLTTAKAELGSVIKGLQDAMAGKSGQVVDASNHFTTLSLTGPHARDILQKLSTLDFHPSVFKTGTVKATAIAHSNVVIVQVAEDEFDILVRWSHADYFWCLTARAGREFGLPEQEVVAGEVLRQ